MIVPSSIIVLPVVLQLLVVNLFYFCFVKWNEIIYYLSETATVVRKHNRDKLLLILPSTSRAGAEYVGNLIYCAGELCKQIIGNDGLSVK